jgi:hypothetical protein
MKDTYRGILRGSEWDGPFSLMVAAPSGRRPWPIQTKSSRDDYVDGKPIEVEFTYPVHFIPVGKRTTYIARVRDRIPVLLKTTGTARVDFACRVHPTCADREAAEVVHFGRDLWWSLPKRPTVQRFAAALSEGEHAAVGLLDQNCVSTKPAANSQQDLNAREIIYDGRDDCVARLQRGAEGLLLSDDQVLLRDGPPLFVLWNGYRNNSILSVGTSEVVVELASSRRNPAFKDASNEIIFGRPFEAADHKSALDFAKANGLVIQENATIEVLLPELMRQDPLKVQLEATLRKLLRLVSIFRAGTEDGLAEIRLERQRLRNLLERDGSSFDWGRGLKEFSDWAVSEPQEWKKKFRIEKLFVRDAIDRIEAECSRRGEPSPFFTTLLNEDDDAAIAGYFK